MSASRTASPPARRRWWVRVFPALVVPLTVARAQVVERPLTLDTVLRIAVDRNPGVRAARAMSRATSARIAATTRPPDPRLQLGLMNYSLRTLDPDPNLGMVQLQVMQDVPWPGKLAAASRVAQRRAESAEARVAVAATEARESAAMAFLDLAEVSALRAVVGSTREVLIGTASTATSRYRAGEGSQTDVLRAQVELARLEEEDVRLVASSEGAAARLAAALDTTVDITAATSLPTLPDLVPALAGLIERALRSRAQLTAGHAELATATAAAVVARRERWPDLQVGVQYGRRGSPMGVDHMGSLMIGASVPVFASRRQLPMREEAAAMQASAQAEIDLWRADTRARVREAHAALTSARRLRLLYRTTIVPQAAAASDAALAAYRTGTGDFASMLAARLELVRLRREQVGLDVAEARAWVTLDILITPHSRPTSTSPEPSR